jgi:hypothetical protein
VKEENDDQKVERRIGNGIRKKSPDNTTKSGDSKERVVYN